MTNTMDTKENDGLDNQPDLYDRESVEELRYKKPSEIIREFERYLWKECGAPEDMKSDFALRSGIKTEAIIMYLDEQYTQQKRGKE